MKIKVGLKWKSIEGVFKGTTFKVIHISQIGTQKYVRYKSMKTGIEYSCTMEHFESYMDRVNKYWSDKSKKYKAKKKEI